MRPNKSRFGALIVDPPEEILANKLTAVAGRMEERDLDRIPSEVERRLLANGLHVDRLQTSPGFVRLRVASVDEAMPVDLVAEPMPAIEPPLEPEPGVRVDTRFAILVNKLGALLSRWAVRDHVDVCALLSRWAVRGHVDVRALLEAGEDLTRGLEEAARREGGFSPQTLAWVLDTAPTVGLDDELATFRRTLVERRLA